MKTSKRHFIPMDERNPMLKQMRPPPQHLIPNPTDRCLLTTRLRTTLEALSSDKPLNEIADELYISTSTLNHRIAKIKHYYNARTLRGALLLYHNAITREPHEKR